MPQINVNAILVLLAYAAITGILNLILAERSRIDAWAEAHPKVAGALKILRAFGFDPWNLVAAASLFFKGKLPDSVRAGKSLPPPRFAKTPSVPPMTMLMLAVCAPLLLCGCGLIAAAAPVLAEAGVVIADAANAVSAAEALLPQLHLDAAQEAKAELAIAKARKFINAAAATDNGAKELTEEQLDASMADFRLAWAELQAAFASKPLGAGTGAAAMGLPVPLAVRRVQK